MKLIILYQTPTPAPFTLGNELWWNSDVFLTTVNIIDSGNGNDLKLYFVIPVMFCSPCVIAFAPNPIPQRQKKINTFNCHGFLTTSNWKLISACHYNDVTMGAMASQITSLTIVNYSHSICFCVCSFRYSSCRVEFSQCDLASQDNILSQNISMTPYNHTLYRTDLLRNQHLFLYTRDKNLIFYSFLWIM